MSYHIKEVEARNFLRLEAVRVSFDKNGVVQIHGKNNQGKSSILKAVLSSLGGGKEIDMKPLREGAEKGFIKVRLEGDDKPVKIEITRNFTPANKSGYLEVLADGKKVGSPQSFIDRLSPSIAIEPVKFIFMRPKDQREILLDITGAKTEIEELDWQRDEKYEERKLQKRERDKLKNNIESMIDVPEDTPDEPISISELVAQKDIMSNQLSTRAEMSAEAYRRDNEIDEMDEGISALKLQLEKASQAKDVAIERREELIKNIKNYHAPTEAEVDAIAEAIVNAEEINQQVRAKKAKAESLVELTNLEKSIILLSDGITDLERAKSDILANSALPPGLTYDNDTLYFNDIPFQQCSDSEKLFIAFKISTLMSPDLRLVISSSGGYFDDDSIRALDKAAKDRDYIFLIERPIEADETDTVKIQIHAGRLKDEPVIIKSDKEGLFA